MTGVRNCVIEVDGQAYDALYQDLIAVEVSERVNEPSSFALQIGIFKQENGSWTRLDETESSAGGFSPWQRVTVALSFDSAPDLLIDGLVAGISPRFTATEGETHLLVWGYDISYKMDLDERVVAWPDKKYSDIAAEIFGNYGLTPNVTDTQVLQTQSRDLLIQRGTDWQFLKRLASHIGFDVSVHGTTGYFRPPDLSRAPQKDLAVNFGQEGTNVAWFEPRLVGDLPGKISMARVNAVTKRIEKIAVSQSPLRALGKRNANALRQGRGISSEPLALGAAEPSFNEQAMEAAVTGMLRRNDWFVSGEGELDGMLYGRALRADGTVLIKGVGRQFSGRYYVTEVTHRVTPSGYTQHFKAIRNGLDLQGDEPFTSEGAS